MATLFNIPENHKQRFKLHNEVHARSSIVLSLPVTASHLALMQTAEEKILDRKQLTILCDRFGVAPPKPDVDHFSAKFDGFLFCWEQHAEFSTYTFFVSGPMAEPFAHPALEKAPVDWSSSLPGKVIAAIHATIMPNTQKDLDFTSIAPYFAENTLIGAEMTGGAAQAFTDFRIHADGFSRFLVYDQGLKSRQAGRLLQRLFEIEVYRVMALLVFPVVRKLNPKLNTADQQLLSITNSMSESDCKDAELLDELTILAAEIEYYISSTHYRSSAASAYYRLVGRRIEDLREVRIQGIQTIGEFMKRRLEPAINTCQTTAKRLTLLSERTSNASQLLRTRVDIVIERQNQALLASMDKRAKIQLRLQETVEGLSIVAITTYVASLVGHVAKAVKSFGWPIEPDLVVGFSIPVIIIVVAIAVRRIHKLIQKPAI